MPWKRRLSAVCQQLHPSSCSAASRQPGEPFFDPSVSVLRQAALVPEESCVIVIDMQNFNGDPNGAEGKALTVRPLPLRRASGQAEMRTWVAGVLVLPHRGRRTTTTGRSWRAPPRRTSRRSSRQPARRASR